ncbi:uncharacterized protein LOC115697791 isoform X1 [Cannabis sativa]|uniref:uncharacterized protein LOC115697791 isoform X1 n=1 Tax=Cannabis sativa TaxID=3483 RepID=UPI0029CA9BC1|nr:uncharacterized protein LOC115697791 isoform X1 [Cannabis sativa]
MDFHTLNRRELQALCKKNKIPANQTNIAMADALQALLPLVEGLEEFLSQPRSDDAQVDEDLVLLSPDPKTSCRTSTRTRKPVLPEPETLQPGTRTRRGTVATPAARSTRGKVPSSTVKDQISVQKTAAYSTRRSVRTLEKTMENLTLASSRKSKDFSEEMADAAEKMDAEIEKEVSEKTQDLNVSNEVKEVANDKDSLVEIEVKALVEQSDETMDVEVEAIDEKEVIDAPLAKEDSIEEKVSLEDSTEVIDAPLAKEDSIEAQESSFDESNDANRDLESESVVAEIAEVKPHSMTLSGPEMHVSDEDFDGKFDFESVSESKELSSDVEPEEEEEDELSDEDSTEEEEESEEDDEITEGESSSEEEADSKVSLSTPSSMVSAAKLSGQFPRPTISTTPRKSSSKKQAVIQMIMEDDNSRVCENEVLKTNENTTKEQKIIFYEEKSLRQLQKILKEKLNNQKNKQELEKTTRVPLQTMPENNNMAVDETQKG